MVSEGRHKPQVHTSPGPAPTPLHETKLLVTDSRRGFGHPQATIRRRLITAGLIKPEPRKRPKSSYIRFLVDVPNEMWQTDMTHIRLADDADVEVLTWLDDHSRYALNVTGYPVVNTRVVVTSFRETAGQRAIRHRICRTTACTTRPVSPAADVPD